MDRLSKRVGFRSLRSLDMVHALSDKATSRHALVTHETASGAPFVSLALPYSVIAPSTIRRHSSMRATAATSETASAHRLTTGSVESGSTSIHPSE